MSWKVFSRSSVSRFAQVFTGLFRGALVMALCFLLSACHTGVLSPMGFVARAERLLLLDSLLLMLLIVVPVVIMSFVFAFRYRRGREAKYTPDWSHNNKLEMVCWGVPCLIIIILAVWAWTSSHKFDPYRQLEGIPGKPLKVQAVSLRWKWLFIYPEENIATVNYLEIPVGRQIAFDITSDAPMNGLFIPQLSSQIYSMGGMRTKLHAVADTVGVYDGFSSNYSGDGFSDMYFKAHVVSAEDFAGWVNAMQHKPKALTIAEYSQIAVPSTKVPPEFYSSVYPELFNKIMMQFMMPHQDFYTRQSAKLPTGV